MEIIDAPDVMRFLWEMYQSIDPSEYADPDDICDVGPNEQVLGPMTDEMKKMRMMLFRIKER